MDLFDSVEKIKGIGPKTLAILNKAGIKTYRDLLYYLPRSYESYLKTTKLSEIRPGKVVVKGKISDLRITRTSRKNFTVTDGVLHDSTDAIRVVWFNQPYRAKQFDPKKEYYFTGTYELNHGHYQLTSPSARLATDVEKIEASKESPFQPIYSVKGSFKSDSFLKIFESIRNQFAFIPDLLPITEHCPDFVKENSRSESFFRVHFPESAEDVEKGRKYLAYEEIFELVLAANLNRQENQKLRATPLKFNPEETKKLVDKLPFELTNAQRKATFEILKNLESETPMNRLLQGDVGSGKTVVAAIAAYQAARNGYQTALLAPTAILATQHAESLNELLAPFGIRVGLLIGSTKNKEALKHRLREGEVDLIVGTHAIITDDTEFKSLAFCIIDEQHRFGVNQRQKLLTKALNNSAPHFLAMTATPIPRSLQLSIFGDLDVSVLNELPKGRQPIKTKILNEINLVDDLYPKVNEILEKKQQVYWICPTIDGTKTSTSVKQQAEKLRKIFPKAEIAFLHGRMKDQEKDQLMSDFSKGKIDILVSTTVVEVGVNVPNASLMIIMDSENYGLAQLHQLRGRVGRGSAESFCYLVVAGTHPPSKRLKELEKSTDGFHLAEVDLEIRGPGEIYGSLQHGALDLNIATLSDKDLIAAAAEHAKAFAKNPENMVKYPELAECIKKYQQLTTLN